MIRLKPVVKKRKEEVGAPEATPSASAVMTSTWAEETASRSRAPQSLVAEPLEETASVAYQPPRLPVPVVLAGDLGVLEPPAALATATAPVQAPVPPPPQVLTLADHGSSAMLGALEEAFSMLDQLRADLRGPDRRRASGRLELVSGWPA
mgnify:CR=1 FL=1